MAQSIPGRSEARAKSIPGNTSPTFTGYTDRVEPKDQYERPMHKKVHGHDALEEVRERHSRLLKARGEQVYYIKRRLEGTYCICYDVDIRMSRRRRCATCYGTGIVGGYLRYVSAANSNDGKIWIAAPIATQELVLEDYGLDRVQNYNYWTLMNPTITIPDARDMRSYDWIARYRQDNTEIGRYYVTNAAISYYQENEEMHQAFSVKLADEHEILYAIDIDSLETIAGP